MNGDSNNFLSRRPSHTLLWPQGVLLLPTSSQPANHITAAVFHLFCTKYLPQIWQFFLCPHLIYDCNYKLPSHSLRASRCLASQQCAIPAAHSNPQHVYHGGRSSPHSQRCQARPHCPEMPGRDCLRCFRVGKRLMISLNRGPERQERLLPPPKTHQGITQTAPLAIGEWPALPGLPIQWDICPVSAEIPIP